MVGPALGGHLAGRFSWHIESFLAYLERKTVPLLFHEERKKTTWSYLTSDFPVGDLYIRSSGPHTARWYHWVSQGSFRELDPLLWSTHYKAANQQALERTLPTKSERNRSKCISSMSYHSESL